MMDKNYYINVADLMDIHEPRCRLPRPKHKSRFIVNHGEILPIISVECEV